MSKPRGLLLALLLLQADACTRVPYPPYPKSAEPGRFRETPAEQIDRGKPSGVLDGIGHYFFSLPTKLVLWNWHVENHNISPETEAALREYLEQNHLDDVKVRLNQYAPGGEWQRLGRNKGVSPAWRYTLGALSVIFYTILPGRIFGGDNYNPFTNTISLYSDVPAVALHEAGHAKDFAEKTYRGTYAALGILPIISLWFEGKATGDALGYLESNGKMCEKKAAYKILYPAYGTYVGGEAVQIASFFTPINQLFSLVAVIPGHIVGRYRASQIECVEPEPTPEPSSSPAPAEAK